MDNEELKNAIKYYTKLYLNTKEKPEEAIRCFPEELFKIIECLKELYIFRLQNNFLVFQYNIDDGIDNIQRMFTFLKETCEIKNIIALPNTYSLSVMTKEELEQISNKLKEAVAAYGSNNND